ncbi:LamG domain protein [Xanthomonas phage XbC2]|nr:LamG domain protein [Xanthomonas phage XbC2]
MLPFPIISKTTIVPSENTIITLLKTGGTLIESNINKTPTDFYTESYNAIQFKPTSAKIQVGSSGIPSIWQIGNSTNFIIETYIKLSSTGTRILCGNLQNNGTGSWWMVINNTFQDNSVVALDGFSTTGSVQRFHFTNQATISPNTWHHIKLQRLGTNLTCEVDGVLIGTLTMTLGFMNQSNPFTVGDSTDNAYPFNGIIDSFNITMSS